VKKVAEWVDESLSEGRGELVQLEAKGLGKLSLVQVEAVEKIKTELEGGCHMQ
jgi:hypothetical protein